MLYEDDVVEAVCAYLTRGGWTIESSATVLDHGDDIVASRGARRLVVEAKGEGSSQSHTRRFGAPFTSNQVRSHVAVAVLRSLGVYSERGAIPALAFPDNPHHRERVARIWPALAELGVVVFWVASDSAVEVQGRLDAR